MNCTNSKDSATATIRKEEPKEHKYKLFYIKVLIFQSKYIYNLLMYLTFQLKDLPYTSKKKDVKGFLKPLVPFTIRLPPKVKGIAYAGFKDERNRDKALLKNKGLISNVFFLIIFFYTYYDFIQMEEG